LLTISCFSYTRHVHDATEWCQSFVANTTLLNDTQLFCLHHIIFPPHLVTDIDVCMAVAW